MKYIITIKLKSGYKMAFSHYEGSFALVPIENEVVRGASAWDSEEEAEIYLKAQLKCAPKLEKLQPFTIEKAQFIQ